MLCSTVGVGERGTVSPGVSVTSELHYFLL
jgi:hypothetical protein